MSDAYLAEALRGARLLYAYTVFIEAPVEQAFRFTGNPDFWTRDFDGNLLPNLALIWEGAPWKPGSSMTLSPLRKDGTATPVGAVRMELLYYSEDAEISFRFLSGNHLIYRFVYEHAAPTRTEFTVNVLVDSASSRLNTIRQRLSAKRRRRQSIRDHLRAKSELERRFARSRRLS